jgi:opacity protein-like surface antigen
MKGFLPLRLALVVGLGLAAGTSRAADHDDSIFSVTPYLWVASVELDSSLPDQPDSGVQRFDTRITAGAMLSATAHYRTVGLFMDFAWLRLQTDALSPGPAYGDVSLRSDFIHSTAALTYQLPLGEKLQAELLVGARLWHVANEFNASAGILPGFAAASDKTWVDPVVGAGLSYDLGQRWSAQAKGLVGGFGVAADVAGEAYAGVSRRVSDSCLVSLGYRYLHEKYDRAGYAFTLDTHGFLVGVGFRF